jgi:hypothetical protein
LPTGRCAGVGERPPVAHAGGKFRLLTPIVYPAHTDIVTGAGPNDGGRKDEAGTTNGFQRRGASPACRNDFHALGAEGIPLRPGNGLQMLAGNAPDLRIQCENAASMEQRHIPAWLENRKKGRNGEGTFGALRSEYAHGCSPFASTSRISGSGRSRNLAFRRVDPTLHPVKVT